MNELEFKLDDVQIDFLREAAGRDGYGDDVSAWVEWLSLLEAGWYSGHTVEDDCKCPACAHDLLIAPGAPPDEPEQELDDPDDDEDFTWPCPKCGSDVIGPEMRPDLPHAYCPPPQHALPGFDL